MGKSPGASQTEQGQTPPPSLHPQVGAEPRESQPGPYGGPALHSSSRSQALPVQRPSLRQRGKSSSNQCSFKNEQHRVLNTKCEAISRLWNLESGPDAKGPHIQQANGELTKHSYKQGLEGCVGGSGNRASGS